MRSGLLRQSSSLVARERCNQYYRQCTLHRQTPFEKTVSTVAMAGPGRGSAAVVVLVALGLLAAANVASAAQHIVGGETNWTIPSTANNDFNYQSWANAQTFAFGDELGTYRSAFIPRLHSFTHSLQYLFFSESEQQLHLGCVERKWLLPKLM